MLTAFKPIKISGQEIFSEPAKQADRVIAPGDGEAEPGELPSSKEPSPRRWAIEGTVEDLHLPSTYLK